MHKQRLNSIWHDLLLCVLLALALPVGCTTADDVEPAGQSAGLSIAVSRAEGDSFVAPDDQSQLTRLYLATRMQEHDFMHDPLHCGINDRYTLTGAEYRLDNLFGQWYKLAFICVPKWENGGGMTLFTEENPKEKTCDYNKLIIDYNEVIEHQQHNINAAATRDLNIYRRVIDRWIDPASENREDVDMTRITGKLVMDFGIPADQFERPVKSISLTLQSPLARVYLRDDSRDDVIAAPEANPADRVFKLDFSGLGEEEYAAAVRQRQSITISLLPQTLQGTVVITFKDTSSALYLPIGEDVENGDTHVAVHKNRITNVLYNGMKSNQFEVRYAGFDTGDDSIVDVDEDIWDGWQDI